MRAKRFLAGALAGVTTLTVIGGCAQEQIAALEPKLELRTAAQQLADAQQAGFTLKLTGNADDLVAAAQSAGGAKEEDVEILRKVFNSSFTLAYDKAGEGPDDDRSGLAATIDGVTGTEIRYVDGQIYAKAPVTELSTKFGAPAGELKKLRREAAAEMPEAAALFDGKWVSFDLKEATELAAGYALGVDPAQQDQQKLMAEFSTTATNLLEGADVVRDSADSKHLIVTSSTTKAWTEVKRLVTAVEPTMAEDLGEAPPEKPIVLDLWIDNGKLTAAEVNVLQFVEGATARVAVRIEVTTGAPITAPGDAVKIDLKGALGGAPGGTLGPDSIGIPG